MSKQLSPTAVIVITRNSEQFIDKCIDSINNQTVQPLQIIISDTGSKEFAYIEKYDSQPNITLIDAGKDVGFCKGNNAAIKELSPDVKYVLLLNPDAFLFPDFIEIASAYMESTPKCGICTGTLFGYDIDSAQPTGLYDSTGIHHTWYGKWYDRDQRSPTSSKQYTHPEQVPAACGALMFCRRETLNQVMLQGNNIFDPSFYMYKEDIDLSIRVQKAGWQVVYHPSLQAYHCRGWSKNRKSVPKRYRIASARNELTIHWRSKSPLGLLYSSMKFLAVKALNM